MLLGYQELPIEIKNQITEVVEIWKKHMQGDLVGVYLHGSICLNAFEPKSGDIDILVVVARSLTTEEKLNIAKEIIAIDGQPCPLEMSAIPLEDARNWKNHGNCVFHYSDFWTEKYEKRFANPEEEVYVVDHEFPDADVTSYIKLVNQCGIVLYGQSIEDTFDQVTDEDFWSAISNEIDDYEFDAYNARYLASNILILGRILSFKIEKRILSKYEAGLWMTEQIPEPLKEVARKAMAVWYQDETREFDQDKLQELRDYLVEEIKR